MGCYINAQVGYYEGDRIHALDTEVPQRPSPSHDWDGSLWVENAAKVAAAARAAADQSEVEADKIDAQLIGDINLTKQGVSDAVDAVFPLFTNPQKAFMRRLVRMAQLSARRVLR